jgi:hypothetical protein
MGTNHDTELPSEPAQGSSPPAGGSGAGEGSRRNRFRHLPHPHIARRKGEGPVKVADQMPRHSLITRFNSRLALLITIVVRSMWCAYLFAGIALVSLPEAIQSHDLIVIVS